MSHELLRGVVPKSSQLNKERKRELLAVFSHFDGRSTLFWAKFGNQSAYCAREWAQQTLGMEFSAPLLRES
jgi:hypothetical protein